MATICALRRWRKFGQMIWLSDRWKTKGIQQVCRGLSTVAKETTIKFPWSWIGSLAFGIFLGYELPKFTKSDKVCSAAEAKTIPRDENTSDSGSPPRSVTFNFIADAVEKAAPAVVNIEVTGRRAGFGSYQRWFRIYSHCGRHGAYQRPRGGKCCECEC